MTALAARPRRSITDGASVLQPLGPAPWAPVYGMLKAQFGVTWVLDVVSQYNAT